MNTGVVLTQSQLGGAGLIPAPANGFLRFANFYVDLKREELFKDGTRVRLPGKVYQALVALLEQPGEVVSREALRQRLWPEGTHVNYDANVNTTVNKLRQVLGDSPEQPKFVETIPRQGYSFVAGVEKLETAPRKHESRAETSTAKDETKTAQSVWPFLSALTPGWLKLSAVALVIAGMLFGAALVIYARHGL